jgi:hypothetical protein
MQRLFGLAFIVGLIWLGAHAFSGGGAPAFLGRWFGAGGDPAASAAHGSPLERARASGEAARAAQEQRIERQLEPHSPQD